MARIIISASVVTDIGKVRQNNEDNFFFNGTFMPLDNISNSTEYTAKIVGGSSLFAICDGMGGEQSGEVAAGITVKNLAAADISLRGCKSMEQHEKDLEAALVTANDEVCWYMREQKKKRVGCTVVVLSILNKKALVTNIGDSRAYLYRENRLLQLSTDHTQKRVLDDLKIVNGDDTEPMVLKSSLTRHIGIFPDEMIIKPSFAEVINLHKNDVFILCSDGLTDMVNDIDILEILKKQPSNPSEALKDTALVNGGNDNVTVLCVKVDMKKFFTLDNCLFINRKTSAVNITDSQ